MTIHLPENLENDIRKMVHSGQFASVDEAMAEATRLLLQQSSKAESGNAVATSGGDVNRAKKSGWEDILDLASKVPDEEFDKLPADGAEQHDHYIYGTPKRMPAP